jgi:hypothetical protein
MYSFGGKKKESEADLPLIQTIKPQLQTKWKVLKMSTKKW